MRLATLSLVTTAAIIAGCADLPTPTVDASRPVAPVAARVAESPRDVPLAGRYIFRHWTFGDEPFWTDTLHLTQVVEQSVSPATALAVGLKVDAERLPPGFLASADLTSPATTVELLRRDAVVGIEARVTPDKHIARLGITCALCHSTVDNSVTAGKYDAEFNRDGINSPVVIPPAFGLRDVALETYTGEGPVSYWNAYVAVTQMHGHGSFSDPALGIDIRQRPDLVTPVLPVLRAYQLSLNAPAPPVGSVDREAAERGQAVFNTTGRCASCHIPSLAFSDVDRGVLHDPAETGTDPVRAGRLKNHQYRTTPLRALWQHPPYFHDGSAASLSDVVAHYDRVLGLGLTPQQQADLVEYLKSL